MVMELTEAYLAKTGDHILQMLRDIKAINIQAATDNFGVGYPSLLSLRDILVDIVKIDRGLVKRITIDIFNTVFIRPTTTLCHDVGKRVYLEGAETKEEYLAMREPGIESIRGFYFERLTGSVELEQKYELNIQMDATLIHFNDTLLLHMFQFSDHGTTAGGEIIGQVHHDKGKAEGGTFHLCGQLERVTHRFFAGDVLRRGLHLAT